MKLKKLLTTLLASVCCVTLLAGCTPADLIDDLAKQIVGKGGSDYDDDDDDDDDKDGKHDRDDDDDDKDHVNYTGNGDFDDQYALIAENYDVWFSSYTKRDGAYDYDSSYTVTDLDRNGLLEVWYINTEEGEFAGYEVSKNKSSLVEITFDFDGDISAIGFNGTEAYEVSRDEIYYLDSLYEYEDDRSKYSSILLCLQDGTLRAELLRGYYCYYDTWDYVYFDKDGNEIPEDDYYDYGLESRFPSYSFRGCSYDKEWPESFLYDEKAILDFTDGYYFAEHAYLSFNKDYYSYTEPEFTFYTDPSSKEYEELRDVIVIPSACKRGVPVRFTCNVDISLAIIGGYWDDNFEMFLEDYDYYNYQYTKFNRVYEFLIDFDMAENREFVISVGGEQFFPTEDMLAGKSKTVLKYEDMGITEELTVDSKYIKLLGMVAYKLGQNPEWVDDEIDAEEYWKLYAEIISACYGVVPSRGEFVLSSNLFYSVNNSFLNWIWFYDSPEESSGEYVRFNTDTWEYEVSYAPYEFDIDAIKGVSLEKDPYGYGYYSEYRVTFVIDYGYEKKEVSFDIYADDGYAFGYSAYSEDVDTI